MVGTVAVTGAGRFIGGHIVRALVTCGVAVRAVDLKQEEWSQTVPGSEIFIGDPRDPHIAHSAIEEQ